MILAYIHRHTSEAWYPAFGLGLKTRKWIPACAGMTILFVVINCLAQTAEDIFAKAHSKMQAVLPVGHFKPCPKATTPDEIIVCGRHERADKYKLERDESPFAGQFKGMTLEEIGKKTAEDPWGHPVSQVRISPADKAREGFERAESHQELPGGFDIKGAAFSFISIIKKAIDNHNDDKE